MDLPRQRRRPDRCLATTADNNAELAEVGTSIVPLYGRHAIGLAQLARTAQSALCGRFTLGIGAASRQAVATMGLAWEHPLVYTREFITCLQPLLARRPADVNGVQVTTHAELNIAAPDMPVLLAALGPRMLELAGRTVHGTTVGQCGPHTIATHIAPRIRAAAADAGRHEPRIMALIRLCVTDDHAGAFALAQDTATRYRAVPPRGRRPHASGTRDHAGGARPPPRRVKPIQTGVEQPSLTRSRPGRRAVPARPDRAPRVPRRRTSHPPIGSGAGSRYARPDITTPTIR